MTCSTLQALRTGLCLGLLALAGCGPEAGKTATNTNVFYKLFLSIIYRNSTVPTVTAAELASKLQQPAPPLLLDVRTPAEYQVSHLAGAQFVNADSIATVKLPAIDRERPVVVYCSVGLRSAKLGQHLQSLGFRQVHNLYGGLFEWINEGHPVVNTAGITSNVHPYSAFWGIWLRRGNKVYE